jgi:site-specific DNA recombinase
VSRSIPSARLVLGYVRVSTDKQAGQGISLDAQAERIRALATVHGLALADVLVDAGESAASLDRPALAKLLAMVDDRQVSTVIVAKLDRLTRSVRDLADMLERFERRDVALMSVSESLDTRSAAGRLVLNVMMSVAQWEREAIGERTREALRHKRAQGQRVGNVPYGYCLADDGRRLERLDDEQNVLATIRALHGDGRSLRSIASELNEKGARTRSGALWRFEYVRNVLKPAGGSPRLEATSCLG